MYYGYPVRPAWGPWPHRLGEAVPGARSCPVPARMAVDRCGTAQPCPALPDLMCVTEIAGIPFEYLQAVRRDPATGLVAVSSRSAPRTQRFTPPAHQALQRFVAHMRHFGMPIVAILTQGSLYCRCIRGTSRLSNHSFGDAIDIAGVRWQVPASVPSRVAETLVHNWQDPEQRRALRRINACLRLSFATVIDYHATDHRDHFHCDTNRGQGRIARGRSTMLFVQEALTQLLGRPVPETGRLDATTQQAIRQFLGLAPGAPLPGDLNRVFDAIFARMALPRTAPVS